MLMKNWGGASSQQHLLPHLNSQFSCIQSKNFKMKLDKVAFANYIECIETYVENIIIVLYTKLKNVSFWHPQ